jgi:hypothetical protein
LSVAYIGQQVHQNLRQRVPEYLDDLEVMLPKEHINGNSSIMPEAAKKVAEEVQASPVIRNSKCGIACIASSPNKKDSVQREFNDIVDHSISTSDPELSTTDSNSVTSTNIVTLTSEIAIMDKFVECGAQGNEEYYMTTKLFGNFENRCMFYTMKTSEGRLIWLKRHYADRRRN